MSQVSNQVEALTKRVAELEEFNQRLLSGDGVTLQIVPPAIPESELLRHWVDQANQQLHRVHELERQLVPMEHELSETRRRIYDLQSQLAWTPVAQGLPTEREQDTWLLLCAESDSPANPLECCRPWKAPTLIKDNARSGRVFTHYRRIELPEAK